MQNIFAPKGNPKVRHNDIMAKSVSLPVDLVPKVQGPQRPVSMEQTAIKNKIRKFVS